jgi:pSer/pThr/pTyr-binding forkhead associated (FHA) protein
MKIGCLTVLDGKDAGKRILLKNLSVFEAGRSQGNHIHLSDESVAYNHFRIYCTDNNYSIYDLGSKRGILVNSECKEKSQLQHGDTIQAADVRLLFEMVDESTQGRLASSAPDSDEEDAQAFCGGLLTKTRASVPALLVLDGQDRGKRFTLNGAKTVFKVGRSAGVDIRLADAKVSREHARIEVGDGSVAITDLDSSNGTVINGEKVKTAVLKVGDLIRLGFTMMKFDRV